jgi:hypothetical protein
MVPEFAKELSDRLCEGLEGKRLAEHLVLVVLDGNLLRKHAISRDELTLRRKTAAGSRLIGPELDHVARYPVIDAIAPSRDRSSCVKITTGLVLPPLLLGEIFDKKPQPSRLGHALAYSAQNHSDENASQESD